MTRGVHFAITDEQRAGLERAAKDEEKLDFLGDHIEEPWEEDYLLETDKAWDGIHRCLSDWPPGLPMAPSRRPQGGSTRDLEIHGSYPLKLCVLGGKRLLRNEESYVIRLIEPTQVIHLAAALKPIDKEWLSRKYWVHCNGAYPEYGEDDLGYTWAYFEELRDFITRMAGNGRSIIFTVSQ